MSCVGFTFSPSRLPLAGGGGHGPSKSNRGKGPGRRGRKQGRGGGREGYNVPGGKAGRVEVSLAQPPKVPG